MLTGAKVAIFYEITKGFSLFYQPYSLFSANMITKHQYIKQFTLHYL